MQSSKNRPAITPSRRNRAPAPYRPPQRLEEPAAAAVDAVVNERQLDHDGGSQGRTGTVRQPHAAVDLVDRDRQTGPGIDDLFDLGVVGIETDGGGELRRRRQPGAHAGYRRRAPTPACRRYGSSAPRFRRNPPRGGLRHRPRRNCSASRRAGHWRSAASRACVVALLVAERLREIFRGGRHPRSADPNSNGRSRAGNGRATFGRPRPSARVRSRSASSASARLIVITPLSWPVMTGVTEPSGGRRRDRGSRTPGRRDLPPAWQAAACSLSSEYIRRCLANSILRQRAARFPGTVRSGTVWLCRHAAQ